MSKSVLSSILLEFYGFWSYIKVFNLFWIYFCIYSVRKCSNFIVLHVAVQFESSSFDAGAEIRKPHFCFAIWCPARQLQGVPVEAKTCCFQLAPRGFCSLPVTIRVTSGVFFSIAAVPSSNWIRFGFFQIFRISFTMLSLCLEKRTPAEPQIQNWGP